MKVRVAQKDDIDAIVKFHIENFPDYFLSNLGYEVLKIYYNQFINNDRSIFLVAIYNDKIIGLALFLDSYSANMKGLIKDNFVKLSFYIGKSILTKKKVRKVFLNKLLKLNLKKEPEANKTAFNTTLLSLATSSSYRGKGVASKLIIEGEKLIGDKGYYLSVLKSNTKGINYYIFKGFSICGDDKEILYLEKKVGE